MAALIPAFISALLVARANTKTDTASEERLQKLYHDTGLSNTLLDLISCIEKCHNHELFKDVNTKEKYEDNMNIYSDEERVKRVDGWGHFSGSTASFHKRAYNRKRRDQFTKARNEYKGCILACIEKFTQTGGSLLDIHGFSSELISYYSPDFVDLMKMYETDIETKKMVFKFI